MYYYIILHFMQINISSQITDSTSPGVKPSCIIHHHIHQTRTLTLLQTRGQFTPLSFVQLLVPISFFLFSPCCEYCSICHNWRARYTCTRFYFKYIKCFMFFFLVERIWCAEAYNEGSKDVQ